MSGRAVIGDVNIWPAIAVEIGADDPETGSDGCSNSGFFGEVLEAVVIVVTDSDSHSVTHVPNSGFFSDVHELELSRLAEKISEEPVPRFPPRRRRKLRAPWTLGRVEHRPLHQIHI